MTSALHYYLAAVHAAHITPRQFREWLSIFPNVQSIYQSSLSDLQSMGLSDEHLHALRFPDWPAVEKSLAWSSQDGCHLLTLEDESYPALLKEITDPPLVLFVRGDKEVLSLPQIAMVGARDVTAYGSQIAQSFAAALSQAGYVITSGMARGVDGASHRGTLAAGGRTIAVTGTGLLRTYPAGHRQLASDIVACGGALVSEFPLDAGPQKYHFPRRNRIISGMCQGVLVVEAAVKSGSLVTARHAVEQGRDVFAVPGSIHSPTARGCHALIRQGAKLVESPQDILEEFGMVCEPRQVEISPYLVMMPENLNGDEQKIYDCIGASATSLDEIILRSGLTASAVSSILLYIELQGLIKVVSGGYVKTAG